MHLDRLIMVLEAVAAMGKPASAAELHQFTGLPLPTCYRLLQSLAGQRLLSEEDDKSRYVIGDRLKRIVFLGQTDIDVTASSAPSLKDAAIEFGEAVFLSRLKDNHVEIIHVETPSDANRSFIHPGLGKRPLHACSCSKAIAAFGSQELHNNIFTGRFRAYTDQTKTSPEQLEKEFETIRELGFAECVEEIEVGVSSVAAPIRIGDFGAPFSVGATGPIRRFTKSHRNHIGRQLIEVADRISSALQVYQNSQAT